jgi:hypothetical protein
LTWSSAAAEPAGLALTAALVLTAALPLATTLVLATALCLATALVLATALCLTAALALAAALTLTAALTGPTEAAIHRNGRQRATRQHQQKRTKHSHEPPYVMLCSPTQLADEGISSSCHAPRSRCCLFSRRFPTKEVTSRTRAQE